MPEVNLAARIIREEGAGLTVGPSDEDGFCESAEKIYRDATVAAEMGMKARAYAEKTFDVKLIGDRFEKLMQQL